jgi:pimeloyl-ACP methyl ester carboxylesterase
MSAMTPRGPATVDDGSMPSAGQPVMRRDHSILPWVDLREGQGDEPCIVALHGSFGEPRDWKLVVSRLAARASFHAVALAPLAQCAVLDLPHAAAMVVRTVQAIRAQRPGAPLVLAGYSFGGRLAASATAALAPRALVLVSARVHPLPPMQAIERQRADAELASALARDGMQVFMRSWHQRPMFAGLVARGLSGTVAASRVASTPSWARILRDLSPGTSLQAPDLSRAARCAYVAGKDDTAYVQEGERLRSSRRGRHLQVTLADAGDGHPTTHALLVEAPAVVAGVLDYACAP